MDLGAIDEAASGSTGDGRIVTCEGGLGGKLAGSGLPASLLDRDNGGGDLRGDFDANGGGAVAADSGGRERSD